MKTIPMYLVDAFASEPFRGNPAAVAILEDTLTNERMRTIAGEMNQSETAFVRRISDGVYSLRWFTPKVEMDLCGHATLGTAAALYTECGETAPVLTFQTRSGPLTVRRAAPGRYVMDFPANVPQKTGMDPDILEALKLGQVEAMAVATKSFLVVEVPESVDLTELAPDFSALGRMTLPKEAHGIVVTRPGPAPYDFTSRMFAPWLGIDEDPVTGAAHTVLAPYWSEKLGKRDFRAFQSSPRGGELLVRYRENGRIELEGGAVTVLRGHLAL